MKHQMKYNEIKWNLINSALAGGLILVGALSTGDISIQSFLAAVVAGVAVFLTKFKDYWSSTKRKNLIIFNFI